MLPSLRSPRLLLRGCHHSRCGCAHPPTARLALGVQPPAASPPAHQAVNRGHLPGAPQTGLCLDNRILVPLTSCQGFGSGRMDGQFPPRNLPRSEKHVHMVEWWQAQLLLAPAHRADTTGHCHRLLFLPVRLPVRTRDRRTLPAWQVKSLLPGRDRPATVLPRADGMLG